MTFLYITLATPILIGKTLSAENNKKVISPALTTHANWGFIKANVCRKINKAQGLRLLKRTMHVFNLNPQVVRNR